MSSDVSLRCLDLFAGRGTASKPFRDRGWEVVTVEKDPAYRPDIVADVTEWAPWFDVGHFDFVWASPPCTVFSMASGGRHFKWETRNRVRWRPGGPCRSTNYEGKSSVPDVASSAKSVPSSNNPVPSSNKSGHRRRNHGGPDLVQKSVPVQEQIIGPAAGLSGLGIYEGNYPFKRSRITEGEVYPITARAIEGVILVKKALDLIRYLEPSFSVLENPVSLLRSIIGPPSVTTSYCKWGLPYLKPTDLWGDLPPGIDWGSRLCSRGAESHERVKLVKGSINQAAVPYELGWSLADAIERYFLDGSLIDNPAYRGPR